ncbi:MAG: flavodoxin family protein, partial [Candidatus Pacebacteria bacterium]|nr:flavodoxin family protein [Candidatus Paceibacterota bacterium]
IEFCNGCLTCDSTGLCNIRDDMQMIYSKLEDADLIILGSPTYFDNVTGMMKNFIDRLEPLLAQDKLKEKKIAFVVVGQESNKSIESTIGYFEKFANKVSMIVVGDLSFIAKDDQDVESKPEEIAKIDEFIKNIIGKN